MKWRNRLDLLTTVVMLVAALTIIYAKYPRRPPAPEPPRVPAQPVSLEGLPVEGVATAPAALIIYSDFDCPYCRAFANTTLPTVRKELVASGQLLVVFKHLPLTSLHPNAFRNAEVAECVRRQGQFWAFHDGMFAPPKRLEPTAVDDLARKSVSDGAALDACVASDAKFTVQSQADEAKVLKINSTPTFMVGLTQPDGKVRVTRVLQGMKAPAEIAAAVSQVLKK